MLPMLAAKMMARMMQHNMIMIFFCAGERGAVRQGRGWHGAGEGGQGTGTGAGEAAGQV